MEEERTDHVNTVQLLGPASITEQCRATAGTSDSTVQHCGQRLACDPRAPCLCAHPTGGQQAGGARTPTNWAESPSWTGRFLLGEASSLGFPMRTTVAERLGSLCTQLTKVTRQEWGRRRATQPHRHWMQRRAPGSKGHTAGGRVKCGPASPPPHEGVEGNSKTHSVRVTWRDVKQVTSQVEGMSCGDVTGEGRVLGDNTGGEHVLW